MRCVTEDASRVRISSENFGPLFEHVLFFQMCVVFVKSLTIAERTKVVHFPGATVGCFSRSGELAARSSPRRQTNGTQRHREACNSMQRHAEACTSMQRQPTTCNVLQHHATACNGMQWYATTHFALDSGRTFNPAGRRCFAQLSRRALGPMVCRCHGEGVHRVKHARTSQNSPPVECQAIRHLRCAPCSCGRRGRQHDKLTNLQTHILCQAGCP